MRVGEALELGWQLDVSHPRARSRQASGRVFHQLLNHRVHLIPDMRVAEADSRRVGGDVDGLRRNAEQHVAKEGRVLDGAGADADCVEDCVEGTRGLHHPVQAMLAIGRAIADDTQKEDGRTVEPVVWVPMASGTIKSATAAARPARGPAGRAREVVRITRLADVQVGEFRGRRLAEDDAAGLATERDAGRVAAGMPTPIGVPHSVGRSTVSMMSLTPKGTPPSGPCEPSRSDAVRRR